MGEKYESGSHKRKVGEMLTSRQNMKMKNA